MINDSSSKDIARKEEETTNDGKIYRGPSSSRQWFGLRDPRVVRVSRTFGGKDRHSKVSTMRGLRDRRVRLSVPTAIQLYDLQDRLGFNQPSKVVDWLLNAAQDDIDKLPPLQIPPELFMHYPHSLLSYQDANPQQDTAISLLKSDDRELKDGEGHSFSVLHRKGVPLCDNIMVDHTRISQSDFVETKIKEGPREEEEEKKNWYKKIEEENESRGSEIQSRNQTSFSSILGTPFPFTSYHNWDPCNSYLSHLGNYGCAGQVSEHNKNSNMSLQPSIPLATSRSSLVLYPATTFPAIFHPTQDSDPKQVMMNSNAQNTLPNSVTTSLYSLNPRYDISRKNHET